MRKFKLNFGFSFILLVFNPLQIAAQQSAASAEELPVPILFHR